jgi:hypothetical protein
MSPPRCPPHPPTNKPHALSTREPPCG